MFDTIKKSTNCRHYFDSRVQKARVKMLEKANGLSFGCRTAIALPVAIASISLVFTNFTAVRVVDIIAKPILKCSNILQTVDENGNPCNYSDASKVRSWILLLPKLALSTIGIATAAAAIAAIAPFYIIGKTIAIMAGHGNSIKQTMINSANQMAELALAELATDESSDAAQTQLDPSENEELTS